MATKTQQLRINKWVAKWKSRLLLDSWSVTVEYKDDDWKDARSDGDVAVVSAEIVVDQRYHEARLLIYPVLFTRPLSYQQSTVAHELLHIATDEIRDVLISAARKNIISIKRRDDLAEGLTEYVTKIMFRAYKVAKPEGNYHI
jgi:hypothetical protein